MVLVHTAMSRKKDDVGSAPPEMFSRLALGDDDAESSPADLTSATIITDEQDKAVQEALDSPQCPAWAKRWLQETQGQEQWGFARYIDHGDIREKLREKDHLFDDELDEEEPRLVDAYKARTARLVAAQHKRIGYGKALSRQFRLQGMTWPQSSVDKAQSAWEAEDEKARSRDLEELEAQEKDDEDNELDLTADELRKRDNMELLKQKFLDGDFTDRLEDDIDLRAKFQVLRTRFKILCDKPRDTAMEKDTKRKGLRPGLLGNVFIVVDKACMDPYVRLNEKHDVEHGWVFAIDPEYKDPGPLEPLASKARHQYRGFVRVKLQDLLDEFFVARKYHERERPMEKLWRQAQKEGNGLFVTTGSDLQ
jgi:hypothetical protein